MKKTITNLLFITATFFCTHTLDAQIMNINSKQSSINWLGKKITGQHEGTINLLSGSLIIENGLLSGGDFVVDMSSISATDIQGEGAKKLEKSLKSEEWFGVAKHPQATLIFTSVVSLGEGLYDITGDFTIKGKTNPTTFEFYLNDLEAKAKVIIDRTLYDILHGSESFIVRMKDKVIYNDFEIEVNIKF